MNKTLGISSVLAILPISLSPKLMMFSRMERSCGPPPRHIVRCQIVLLTALTQKSLSLGWEKSEHNFVVSEGSTWCFHAFTHAHPCRARIWRESPNNKTKAKCCSTFAYLRHYRTLIKRKKNRRKNRKGKNTFHFCCNIMMTLCFSFYGHQKSSTCYPISLWIVS